jgi:hypothetical protein
VQIRGLMRWGEGSVPRDLLLTAVLPAGHHERLVTRTHHPGKGFDDPYRAVGRRRHRRSRHAPSG